MLSKRHWGVIFTKLTTYWSKALDRTAEEIYYDALKDRVSDEQIDGAYRHLIGTSSRSDFFPKVEDILQAVSKGAAAERMFATGSTCDACDSHGHTFCVGIVADYEIGGTQVPTRKYVAADAVIGEDFLADWQQPCGWATWVTAVLCQCEKGERVRRGVERSNADPKADCQHPIPPTHRVLTGRNAIPDAYGRCHTTEDEIGRLLTRRWGPARGGRVYYDPAAPVDVPRGVGRSKPVGRVVSPCRTVVEESGEFDADGVPF